MPSLLAALAFTALLSVKAEAAPKTCPYFFGLTAGFTAGPPGPQALLIQGAEDAALRANLTELVPRLDELMGGPLREPVSVQLTTNFFYSDAFYLPDERTVKLGVKLGGRSEEARLGVFAHEYAHAYFQDKFRYWIGGEWRNEKEARAAGSAILKGIEATPRFQEIEKLMAELGDAIPRHRARGEKEALEAAAARYHALKDERILLVKPYADEAAALRRQTSLARAYSELHSDAVAAVAMRNPAIVAEALGIAEQGPYVAPAAGANLRKQNTGGARPRTFAINKFKDWRPEDRFVNEYAVLDPARGVLWPLYLENLPPEAAPKFFETFLRASEAEVKRIFEAGADDTLTKSPAPPALNRNFLRAFRETAKANDLPTFRRKPR